MIEANLKLNGFNADIVCAALVHNETKRANLYTGNNGNVWRNSLFKNWNGKGLVVDCLNFDETVPDGVCVKMDIEGGEMPILEATRRVFKKMVFEWSFGIDASLPRFWAVIDRLNDQYNIASMGNVARIKTRDYNIWQKSWFPACTNVYCHAKD